VERKTKTRKGKICLGNEDERLSIGSLPYGYLIARLRHACAVGGCLDGEGGDTTVGCVGDVFVQLARVKSAEI
jgi:hypothetical protein